MSTDVWDWLPDGALAAPEVLGVFDGALEDWSVRWFPSWRLLRQGLSFAGPPPGEPVVAAGSSLLIRGTAVNAEVVATRALNMDLARLQSTDGDQAVLDGFRDHVLLDLARTVETAFASEVNTMDGGSGRVVFDLRDDDGRKLLLIETTRAVLGRSRRNSLTPRPLRRTPLNGIETAIAELPVTVQARLGSSLVPLSEARRLTAGDILVLDHALDTPFELTGADDMAIACATLVDAASPRSLRLQAAPGRQRQ